MKNYVKPEIEIINLKDINIITCSDPFEEIDEDIVW